MGAILDAVDTRLFRIDVGVLLVKYGVNHIAAPSCKQFVYETGVKVSGKPKVEKKSLGSENCVFVGDSTFFAILLK